MLIKDLELYIVKRKGAIHIGGHEGEECEWYYRLNFSKVLWFEPCVESFKKLKQNMSRYNNQMAVNLGVHDSLKTAILHTASNDGESSSILNLGTHKIHHPKIHYIGEERIDLVRMDRFLNHKLLKGFNFLNVDVQGVELNVIKSFGKLINNFDYIYTEINEEELYEGGCLVGEIDSYLSMFGFERTLTKMTQFKWGDALYIKNNGNI